MPDSEFQNLIEALPSYDWDLAVKLEGCVSISQVPDSLWDEFIEFYKDYYSPKPTRKEKTENALLIIVSVIAITVFVLVVMPWAIENIYPQVPQEIKKYFLDPILDFAVRFRWPLKTIFFLALFSNTKDRLKNK